MIPRTITKRDGKIVAFDAIKIRNAINGAAHDVPPGEPVMSDEDIDYITEKVVEKLNPRRRTVTVEHVQDLVEATLLEFGFSATAKAYIVYRAEHARRRSVQDALMEIYKDLSCAERSNTHPTRENAHNDGTSSMAIMLNYGAEGAKYFCNREILPQDVAAAQLSGEICIHDEDFYMLTEASCHIDPLPLFEKGFSTGHGYLRPPQSIVSRAALACIVIQSNQNEMHGCQNIPNFDFAMAPGVALTFRKSYANAMADWLEITLGMEHNEALHLAKDHILPDAAPVCMAAEKELPARVAAAVAGLPGAPVRAEQAAAMAEFAWKTAIRQTRRDTYQAMESLIHNLNTMNSRAGAKVPFSSINYGTDTSPEGRMVIRELLGATDAGLGAGETALFPVQVFKMKAGVSYNEGDPNFDLFQLAVKVAAHRLCPNFANLDAPFNLRFWKPGDYNSEVAYMGDHSRIMENVHDPEGETTCGRGILSCTTINLPEIALEARGDRKAFLDLLDARLDLVVRQLEHRFSIQSARRVSNYPILMGEGVWRDSLDLELDEEVGEVLKHGAMCCGFTGLAEALVALVGAHHGESAEAQALGLEIVGRMRARMDRETQAKGINFTLLATPAEALGDSFVTLDRERFGAIARVTDKEDYTPSFHVPDDCPLEPRRRVDVEAPYHALTNGGHLTYVTLTGPAGHDPAAFEDILRYMHDHGIGYGAVARPLVENAADAL